MPATRAMASSRRPHHRCSGRVNAALTTPAALSIRACRQPMHLGRPPPRLARLTRRATGSPWCDGRTQTPLSRRRLPSRRVAPLPSPPPPPPPPPLMMRPPLSLHLLWPHLRVAPQLSPASRRHRHATRPSSRPSPHGASSSYLSSSRAWTWPALGGSAPTLSDTPSNHLSAPWSAPGAAARLPADLRATFRLRFSRLGIHVRNSQGLRPARILPD